MLQEMIDVWYDAWTAYHSYTCIDAVGDCLPPGRSRWERFTEPGDTRDARQSLAEFDDRLTSWIGSRDTITWRIRPRWTSHFNIECELVADWSAR